MRVMTCNQNSDLLRVFCEWHRKDARRFYQVRVFD